MIDAERVLAGLDFPTSLGFADDGALWVAESGLPFAGAAPGGRVRRGERVIARDLRAPVNGLLWHAGAWIVSEGGKPGRISRLTVDGERTTLVDDLPGAGDYHTNMCVLGADQKLYFGQGSATNLGVVGLDSYDLGWVGRLPVGADIPGLDLEVSDATFETPDPRTPGARATTGVFSPFGTADGQRRIPGRVPCTAAVMRCHVDGSGLELFAWGLRNPFGLLVLPDGRLLATDQGADDRGSRRVDHAPDCLYEVRPDAWYGFPDFIAGLRIDDPRFHSTTAPPAQPMIRNHGELPPLARPLFEFPVNTAATKLARIPDDAPRFAGQLLVCLFGDERPLTGPAGPKVGRSLARLDLAAGALHPLGIAGVRRPIDVRIHAGHIYLLDFGEFEMAPGRVDAVAGSGTVHRFPLSAL